MKYCKECGAPLKDSALYCYVCGTPYGEKDEEGTPGTEGKSENAGNLQSYAGYREEKHHTGLKVFFSLLLILVLAVLVYALYSPALRTLRLIRSSNLDGAEAVYNATVQANEFENTVLRFTAGPAADLIVRDYNKDRVNYKEAQKELNLLQKLEDPANEANARIKTLKSLRSSKKAYAAGIEAEQKGDYAAAMTGYANVVKEDVHYENAQTKAQSMAKQYKTQILKTAGNPKTAKEYENAIRTLTAAQKVLPKDQDFTEKLSTLKQDYSSTIKGQATTTAKDYISKGYYKQAIDLLNQALTYSENDMELQSLLTTATTDYEEFVKEQLEIYQGNKDYDGAMKLLKRVRKDLPDDAVIDQLYETTKASKDLYQ